MIISASRRTDIPAFFSDWFFKRLDEGYAYVRNPMNTHQISRINLSPDFVDCIVFWSKNPEPIISKLNKLKGYLYYFQFSLNAYGRDMERNLPSLEDRVNTFRTLSGLVGKQRNIWRYDPIILNHTYTIDWHMKHFSCLADKLSDYTEKCTISFVDFYPKISTNLNSLSICELSCEQKNTLAKELSLIARSHGLSMDTCAEDIDLSSYCIEKGRCIDDRLISRLLGCPLDIEKDKNQRGSCGCVSSIDLGLYNTCENGCIYCYANHSSEMRSRNLKLYDKTSPLLCGRLTESDNITERNIKSHKNMQLRFFP